MTPLRILQDAAVQAVAELNAEVEILNINYTHAVTTLVEIAILGSELARHRLAQLGIDWAEGDGT